MAIEKKFVTSDDIDLHRFDFDEDYLNQLEIDEIVKSLDSSKVWYTGNLNEKPKNTSGLVICSNCAHLYWITPKSDAYKSISTPLKKIEGPFCYPCSMSIISNVFHTH